MYWEAVIGFAITTLSGVVVSLFTLQRAEQKRVEVERQKAELRQQTILTAIGREIQWNRTATRELDAGNAHYKIGKLSTVAFERHGAELATLEPDCTETVFKHYSLIYAVREGIRALREPPVYTGAVGGWEERRRHLWVKLSEKARVDASNSATQALECLGLLAEWEPVAVLEEPITQPARADEFSAGKTGA